MWFFVVFFLFGVVNGQSRQFVITNNCTSSYYINLIAGSYQGGSCPSGLSSQCMAGATCNPANKICYYNNPTLSNWLVAPGQQKTMTFTDYGNAGMPVWSGNMNFCDPATGCDQDTTTCGQKGCGVARGPANLAEFTLLRDNVDFYDISNIGGVNVPMSMAPINAPKYSVSQPYSCGVPGQPYDNTYAPVWNFQPPSPYHRWVAGSPYSPSCVQDSDCSSGNVCGMIYSQIPGHDPSFSRVCGKLSGYWTSSEVCRLGFPNFYPSFYDFKCTTPINNAGIATTVHALDQCVGPSAETGSCYQNGANGGCCGCSNWWESLGNGYVPSSTERCKSSSAAWTNNVQPMLSWLKKACPSCYTYPYDDMSSTFTCSSSPRSNSLNYAITLCPAQRPTANSGSPAPVPTPPPVVLTPPPVVVTPPPVVPTPPPTTPAITTTTTATATTTTTSPNGRAVCYCNVV